MGFTSTLTKAATKVVQKITGTKAMLAILKEPVEAIPVQFNPSEYRISDRTTFSQRERNRKDDPVVNFNGSPLALLTVKLYFDCDEVTSIQSMVQGTIAKVSGDEKGKEITSSIEKITSLTKIDGDSHQPPPVAFFWGSLQFVGYAENVTVTYTMFDKSGKPLRAVVDLSIRGQNNASEERKSPLMSPDRTKARTMTEDNNIWNIAEKEYGDVHEWRRIADANGIMNPLDIPIGKVLKVPSINEKR